MLADELIDELMTRLRSDGDWSEARCQDGWGTLTALFFSDQLPHIARAKAICAGCPLRTACLEGAGARREPSGVWGGQLFANGTILAQKRKRGRPAKASAPAVRLTA